MHPYAYDIMEQMVKQTGISKEDYDSPTCFDVGSYNVNGTLGFDYRGIDIEEGPNVDIVVPAEGEWTENFGSAPLVISGNALEHVEDMIGFMRNIASISSDYVLIQVPNRRDEHKHPIDCWRVFPDGLKYLFKESGIAHIDSGIFYWDTWGIGRVIR